MANISAGVYTKIVDLSTFVQAVPGTIGFICALTEKGRDNKIVFLSGQQEFVDEFGEPNISLYGTDYGQGSYIAYNYLGESGSLKFMRCLPDDATLSNLRIDGLDYDTTTLIEISYVADINNNTTDITTALEAVGVRNPLVIFYPIGRGAYYNRYSIELDADPNQTIGVYVLKIYEQQSDGDDVIIESYKISFDKNAKDIYGNSIFVEYILEQHSKVMRAKVGTDGFNLLERVFDNEQSPVTVDYIDVYSTSDATRFVDATAFIDATRVIEVERSSGNLWTTTSNLNSERRYQIGVGNISDQLSFGGIEVSYSDITEKWNDSAWATTTSMNYTRYNHGGCGLTSGALEFCGGGDSDFYSTCSIWDGSTWANTSALSQTKRFVSGVGITNAALCMGGQRYSGSYVYLSVVERFAGTTWATTSSLNTSRGQCASCGNSSSALIFSGLNPTLLSSTEIWNGSAWATTTSVVNSRTWLGGCGDTSNALNFAGSSIYGNTTEIWNGSTWATTSTMNWSRNAIAGDGNTVGALAYGNDLTVYEEKTDKWYTTYITIDRVEHYDQIYHYDAIQHYTVTTSVQEAQITNDGQDFSQWETDPDVIPLAQHPYTIIVRDFQKNEIWGYIGLSEGDSNQTCNVYQNKLLTEFGWAGDTSSFLWDRDDYTYIIKKSNNDLTTLFSSKPLRKGSDGSLISAGSIDTSIATQLLAQGYAGQIDPDVMDVDSQYFSLVYDAGYPKNVKDQIVGLAQAREDCVAIVDVGDNADLNSTIESRRSDYPYNTYYASLFSPYTRIFDIWTERQVWFSPCYHMAYLLPQNDRVGELWFAAAGNNRGVCRGIEEIRYTPRRSQRDLLYLDQINPIIHQNNSYMIWSQLTSQSKASAMQDLNVVRLVLYISTAIKQFANSFVFEQNGPLTWNSVQSNVTVFLDQIKKKRGLFNYSVEVGATDIEIRNKTFHINVTLEPIKVAEKIELNFYIK